MRYNETAERPYGISMFHGLHCLKMLREVIQSSRPGMDGGEHGVKDGGHGKGLDMNHVGHCIGYIAQVREIIEYRMAAADV